MSVMMVVVVVRWSVYGFQDCLVEKRRMELV
jgi:hypothetical protein